ncbi:hypothetical protein F5B21DRAFT_254067 [Xylaria acuta]|nr:hypothetical protein F5B21DRAFT_254067 [Xylaria acuta]
MPNPHRTHFGTKVPWLFVRARLRIAFRQLLTECSYNVYPLPSYRIGEKLALHGAPCRLSHSASQSHALTDGRAGGRAGVAFHGALFYLPGLCCTYLPYCRTGYAMLCTYMYYSAQVCRSSSGLCHLAIAILCRCTVQTTRTMASPFARLLIESSLAA